MHKSYEISRRLEDGRTTGCPAFRYHAFALRLKERSIASSTLPPETHVCLWQATTNVYYASFNVQYRDLRMAVHPFDAIIPLLEL